MEGRIFEKDDLLSRLSFYDRDISDECYLYIKKIVELNDSLFKYRLKSSIGSELASLDLYRDVVAYYLYNKLKLILSNNCFDDDVFLGSNDQFEDGFSLNVLVDDEVVPIFLYDYVKNRDSKEDISCIHLYLFENYFMKDIEKRKEIMDKLKRLNNLYESPSPLLFSEMSGYRCAKRRMGIEYRKYDCKKMLKRYRDEPLTDFELKRGQLENKYYNLLVDEFGIDNYGFREKMSSGYHKTMIRRYPGVNVEKHTRKL